MFGFHGWFCLKESPLATNEGDHLDKIVKMIRTCIRQMDWNTNLFAEIRPMNGEYFLYVGGNKNRRGVVGKELDDFLSWVAETAPGSFGLLYWHDDEGTSPAGQNGYQVNVMSRGAITTRLDPFLSPVIPTLEDAWEPD